MIIILNKIMISVSKISFYIKGEEKTISLALWDTCGQERFKSINKIFIKGSQIILLVYDITSRNSLEQLNDYYKDAMDCVNNNEIVLGVICNKCDLYEYAEVSLNEVNIFSEQINAQHFECSCYDLESVNIIFQKIAKIYFDKYIRAFDELFVKDITEKPKPNFKMVINIMEI